MKKFFIFGALFGLFIVPLSTLGLGLFIAEVLFVPFIIIPRWFVNFFASSSSDGLSLILLLVVSSVLLYAVLGIVLSFVSKKIGKWGVISAIVIYYIIFALLGVSTTKTSIPTSDSARIPGDMSTFEECVAAGNTIIEGNPRKCQSEYGLYLERTEEKLNEQSFYEDGEEWVRYAEKEIGLYFEYRKDPSGYVVTNPTNDQSIKSFILHPIDEFNNKRENSEGGSSISIEVFNPGPNTTSNDWIESYDNSNYAKDSLLNEIQMGNNIGVSYEWEGLYKGETAVVAWKGWIYTVSIMYNDKNSQIYKDYEEIISSLKILFIENIEDDITTVQTSREDLPTAGKPKLKAIDCLLEQRNVDACIEIYKPVCGQVQVECIKAPCYPVKETFENSCKACTNLRVISYTEGECLDNDEVKY